MEESDIIFVLRVFVGPEQINDVSVCFACDNIFPRGRMIESIKVIEHMFIKPILFWDVIENRSILPNNKILLGKMVENSL